MRREPALNYAARFAREARSIVKSCGAVTLLREFQSALRNAHGDIAAIRRVAVEYARRLWRFGCASVFAGTDLALHWSRLRMLAMMRVHFSARAYATVDPRVMDRCLRMFDLVSRNQMDAGEAESEVQASSRVTDRGVPLWITGFDPYGLSADRPDSLVNTNPSGAAVLALHGRSIVGRSGRTYRVRGALFPVRYRDFDEHGLERFLRRRVPRDCPFLFTISMGAASDAFHLDRFPANRRGGAADNAGESPGPGPILTGGDPQFVECRLSPDRMAAMVSVESAAGPFAVIDWREVESLGRGRVVVRDYAELAGETAVRGSGGDYLSNEITYRVIREIQAGGAWPALETVHIHTPRVSGGDVNAPAQVRRIVAQIQAMLIAVG